MNNGLTVQPANICPMSEVYLHRQMCQTAMQFLYCRNSGRKRWAIVRSHVIIQEDIIYEDRKFRFT